MAKYIIFNATDSTLATNEVFTNLKKANEKINQLRNLYQTYQGYYKTAYGERIDPEDISYHIIEQRVFNKNQNYFYQ